MTEWPGAIQTRKPLKFPCKKYFHNRNMKGKNIFYGLYFLGVLTLLGLNYSHSKRARSRYTRRDLISKKGRDTSNETWEYLLFEFLYMQGWWQFVLYTVRFIPYYLLNIRLFTLSSSFTSLASFLQMDCFKKELFFHICSWMLPFCTFYDFNENGSYP